MQVTLGNGTNRGKARVEGGQLLSKYKLCALNPVKVTNYFCEKGSKIVGEWLSRKSQVQVREVG